MSWLTSENSLKVPRKGGGVLLCVALATLATRLEPDHTVATEIPHSSEAYQALVHVDKVFDGAIFAYATLTWPGRDSLRSEELYETLAEVHAVVMFLMIWIGLRSFRYALVSLLPNVFPLLCTAGFLVLSGRCLEMSSVIVFSISLGIAVDDTIHFLVCYQRERRHGAGAQEAIGATFRKVGAALVMTTVALIAGHTVVLFSGFPAIRKFGLLTAITIGTAPVGDLLLLPALLAWRTSGLPRFNARFRRGPERPSGNSV